MKIKVEIDLDDIWIDGEDSFSEGFKNSIKNLTTSEVMNRLKDNIDREIVSVSTKYFKDNLKSKVEEIATSIIENNKFRNSNFIRNSSDPYRAKEFVTIEEYIEYTYLSASTYHTPKDYVEKQAKLFSSQIKDRYDMMFATQLVKKMSDQGLLKEGVYNSLIEK